MRASELRDLFEYAIDSRSRLLAKARELGWEAFVQGRGATWDSMLLVYLHILDVEDGWLEIAAHGGDLAHGPDRKAADYSGFDAVEADSLRVAGLTRSRIAGWSDDDLARPVRFLARDPLERTPERIAMHAFIDEVAHLGELICLFWQQGVEPPYIDWLDYRLTP
jgi:uncharacterized damage-inducible protein DinB